MQPRHVEKCDIYYQQTSSTVVKYLSLLDSCAIGWRFVTLLKKILLGKEPNMLINLYIFVMFVQKRLKSSAGVDMQVSLLTCAQCIILFMYF